jgi:hypothetical protein
MQAMELPTNQRQEIIRHAATAVRREFEQKHPTEPMIPDATRSMR